MIEKPAKGRAIINKDFSSLEIIIPVKKNWLVIIFMTIWMFGWLMGETFAIVSLFNFETPPFPRVFLMVWLALWTIAGIIALFAILWQFIGREIINLERGVLKIEKTIKGIGRKKAYEISSIDNMALNPTQDFGLFTSIQISIPFGIKNGKIKFDYGMKTIKFANEIDEAEARVILNRLKEDPNLSEKNFPSSSS